MAASGTAFSYRVTPVNCFLSAREEVKHEMKNSQDQNSSQLTNKSPYQVDELVFAFRWALVSGWVKFFNWVDHHFCLESVEIVATCIKGVPLGSQSGLCHKVAT